jgi:chorismate mutase
MKASHTVSMLYKLYYISTALVIILQIPPNSVGAWALWGPLTATTSTTTTTSSRSSSSNNCSRRHRSNSQQRRSPTEATTTTTTTRTYCEGGASVSSSATSALESSLADGNNHIHSGSGGGGSEQRHGHDNDVTVMNHGHDNNNDDNDDNDNNHCVKTVDLLSLDSIRSTLIRQEETIIFALIERAQFRHNAIVYRPDGFGTLGIPIGSTDPPKNEQEQEQQRLSFMEYMLVGTEALHCGARRYKSPEEHAFFPERLPSGPNQVLPELQYSTELLSTENGAANVNFNKRLLHKYISTIVPSVCRPGDDEQHGSTVLCDIAVLQALSRRVHYGKFVAESKYRSDPTSYQRFVDADDAEGVMRLLTDHVVEEKVLRRARLKAATYGMEPLLSDLPPIEGSDATSTLVAAAAASAVVAALSALNVVVESSHRGSKVDPSVIEQVYRDIIIPMTKDIELAYLFLRCGKEPPSEHLDD